MHQRFSVFSLYPWVNKYGRYPAGHPQIITENFAKLTVGNQPYYGLIQCTIIARWNLFFPVLPYRGLDHRLYFALCRTCCNEKNRETSCSCTDDERTFIGTWTSDEIDHALKRGYEVLAIDEVWHYPKDQQMQYDGENEDSGLFVK